MSSSTALMAASSAKPLRRALGAERSKSVLTLGLAEELALVGTEGTVCPSGYTN
jgi:hypothetical protein